jgi:hypothetical protein
MKRKLSRALAVAVHVAGMSIGIVQSPALADPVQSPALAEPVQSPALADPGHCWRQGFGPVYANPSWSYQLKNACSRSINARVVLQTGHRLVCKLIPAYGNRVYLSPYYSSYFWGENC